MKSSVPLFAGLLSLAARTGRADPTWPAATDHMEEIVFQLQGVRGSLFNDLITPCNNEAAGPGRVTASEWLRVAFHDIATANRFFGTGGLDASIQFEMTNGENTGPGHNTTLRFYSNYLTSRSSMADLIAAGTYASVRACGGPAIPLRLGRRDATAGGSTGVPQPQNAISTFRQQFDRMGFSQTEMIQLVACGHTLGSVHREEFPALVPEGAVNGQIGLDSTNSAFDNKVVTEYVDGTTQNPLVVGPAVALNRHSDFKVFNADGNATVNTMTDPAAFQNICRTVLQKMIDVVPPSVVLSDPITPYTVKPVDMQLTLNADGLTLLLTGLIRVRTTEMPASTITNVVLTWRDRSGGNSCGSLATCSTTVTLQGVAQGLDDTFGYFPINVNIPVAHGISSFVITINRSTGGSLTFDNNGNAYPLQDIVIYQKPQSCLIQNTGALTVTALVRNDVVDNVPVTLDVSFLTPRPLDRTRNPVPILGSASVTMTKGDCVGGYTFYTASYTLPGALSYNARIGVTAGGFSDDFNHAGTLAGTCLPYSGAASCSPVSTSSVASSSTTSTASSTSSTATTTPTPAHKPTVGGYVLLNCWTEAVGVRALSGAGFAYDGMTLESCMGNCTGFDYWGTEYGRECYCGNTLHSSSTEVPLTECNMPCSGDASEFCGAGNRIELYSTTATRSTSATPTPTGGLARKPTVGPYVLVGCQTEAPAGRALSATSYAADDMTLESCAAFCSGYNYFGTEYGRECYCGNALASGSTAAPQGDCSMTCAGNPFEYCGAGNRLELYQLASSSSSLSAASSSSTTTAASSTTTTASSSSTTTASSSSSTASSSSSSTTAPTGTLGITPTVASFTFVGCWTEATAAPRALSGKTYASGTEMTLESCADYCEGFRYFGTEYSAECFCGNALHASSAEAPSAADCSMTCSGNPLQYCGGGNRLQLYEDPNYGGSSSGPSHPATVAGGWTFEGCRTEATGVRALGEGAYASGSMTLENCAAFCQGYDYFGTEYGGECYCGNSFGAGSVVAPVEECSMACSGSASQFCGAGNRLSVYTSSS